MQGEECLRRIMIDEPDDHGYIVIDILLVRQFQPSLLSPVALPAPSPVIVPVCQRHSLSSSTTSAVQDPVVHREFRQSKQHTGRHQAGIYPAHNPPDCWSADTDQADLFPGDEKPASHQCAKDHEQWKALHPESFANVSVIPSLSFLKISNTRDSIRYHPGECSDFQ